MRAFLRLNAAVIVAAALLVSTTACFDKKSVEISPPASPAASEKIVGITMTDGRVFKFDAGAALFGDVLRGDVDGNTVEVPVANIERFFIVQKKFNAWKTIGLVVAIPVIAVAIIAAVKQSCPFVYSWDGSRYVFDAEPYGGAITRGLERDDDTVLEHLRADQGLYRLLLTNEVDETQMTNVVSLRVVDHAAAFRIVPGGDGSLHTVGASLPPTSARAADGRDLIRWLAATDDRIFEPEPAVGALGVTRDEIVLTFPKPPEARRAKLVVNAGTALFGSLMIKESLRLRGRELTGWYDEMDRNPDAAPSLHRQLLREELWALKLDVAESTGWETRGTLIGTGPLIVKDRVVPLDVSRVTGEQLRIRVRPPRGYWALNSFAVDYSGDESIVVTDVSLLEAHDERGRDRRTALVAADGAYDEMPVGGDDRVFLSFRVPEPKEGLSRTVVLHARGWYRLNLVAEGEPDREAIRRFETEPGFGVRFAAERYAHWRSGERRAPH